MTQKEAEKIATAIEDFVNALIEDATGDHDQDYIGRAHHCKQALVEVLQKTKTVTVVKR